MRKYSLFIKYSTILILGLSLFLGLMVPKYNVTAMNLPQPGATVSKTDVTETKTTEVSQTTVSLPDTNGTTTTPSSVGQSQVTSGTAVATSAPSGTATPAAPKETKAESDPKLMAFRALTIEEQLKYLEKLDESSEEAVKLFLAQLTAEERAALEAAQAQLNLQEQNSVTNPTFDSALVNFTNAAPFGPPAEGPALRRARMAPLLQSAAAPSPIQRSGSAEADGVMLDKTAVKQADGSYKITLEAFTTGTVTTTTEKVPTDVVLVLDQSGSMREPFGYVATARPINNSAAYNKRNFVYEYYTPFDTVPSGGYNSVTNYAVKIGTTYKPISISYSSWTGDYTYQFTRANNTTATYTSYGASGVVPNFTEGQLYQIQSRKDALKTAVGNFVNAVYTQSLGNDGSPGGGDDIDHRVSLVGFSIGSPSPTAAPAYYNTEILSLNPNVRYAETSAFATSCATSLLNVQSSKATLDAGVAGIDAYGSTRTDLGMKMARLVFAGNTISPGVKRNRVVVVFTDGTPTSGSSYEATVANAAIAESNTIKSTYAGTVYGVGIFAGADPNGSGNENTFMKNLVTPNTGAAGSPGYFLTANDPEALNNVFTSISSNITAPTIALGTSTVIRDIVSPQFQLPPGMTAGSVTRKTYSCTGFDNITQKYTFNPTPDPAEPSLNFVIHDDTGVVDANGFDFTANCVTKIPKTIGGNDYGRKLVVSFVLTPKTDFFGGNGVVTNGSESGIYKEDGTPIKLFPKPQVDIQLKYGVSAFDQSIYLSQAVDLAAGVLFKDSNNVTYRPDGKNNAYVNIKYTFKNMDDTEFRTYTIPAGQAYTAGTWSVDPGKLTRDKQFKVLVDVAPLTAGSQSALDTITVKPWVYVFRPEIQYTDTTIFWGATTNLNDRMAMTTIGWKADKATATIDDTVVRPLVQLIPQIAGLEEPTYPNWIALYKPDMNSHFKGLVKLGTTTSDMMDYTNDALKLKATSANGEAWMDFTVFVTPCSLTITKAPSPGTTFGSGDSFIFMVTSAQLTNPINVVIHGAASIKLSKLPAGSYTVTENTSWSWRYTPTNPVQTVNLEGNSTGYQKTVTFTNSTTSNPILGGEDYAQNIFTAIDQPT